MRPMVDVVWSHPPRPAPPTRREEAFCRKDSGDLIRLSTSEDQLLRCHEKHAITHVKALCNINTGAISTWF